MSEKLNVQKWVDNYGDQLYSFALGRVRDKALAQDLVQACFLGALKNQNSFKGHSSEKTWLFGILKNKISDSIRGKYRGMRAITDSRDVTELLFDEKGNWKVPPEKWAPNPHNDLENVQLRQKIETCVGELSESYREVYTMRLQNEYSTEECCNVFGITPTNLRVLLHRVRHQLRRCLEINWFNQNSGEK